MNPQLTKSQKQQKKAARVAKKRSAIVVARKLADEQAQRDAVLVLKVKAKADATAAKKMTPKERKEAEAAAKRAEKTEVKKLKAIMSGPRVFLNFNNHAYLLVEAKKSVNRYLTMRDGSVHVEEIGRDSREMAHLRPYLKDEEPYELKQATQKFYDCLLSKTSEAIAEMCKILGKPVPEIPPEVKAARKARGQRLQAARVPRVGYTIQQLCEKLKVEPTVARKMLRKAKIEKPQAGWVWPTEKEADEIARKIGLTQK